MRGGSSIFEPSTGPKVLFVPRRPVPKGLGENAFFARLRPVGAPNKLFSSCALVRKIIIQRSSHLWKADALGALGAACAGGCWRGPSASWEGGNPMCVNVCNSKTSLSANICLHHSAPG